KRTTLRIDATSHRGFCNPLNREPVEAEAHRHALRLVNRPRLVERTRDDVVELCVHLVLFPEVLLEALHPLEVRDDDTTRVGEDVREDQDAVLLEDLVG